eukprot:s503_g10.t1
MATAAVQVQADDHLQLAPDEVRSYLDDAGFASVYLKGTEYGMPVMFLQAADAEITDQALNTALASMGAVLRDAGVELLVFGSSVPAEEKAEELGKGSGLLWRDRRLCRNKLCKQWECFVVKKYDRATSSLRTMPRVPYSACSRTPSMHNSSTIIKWMNDDEMSPLLSQHALVTCVMVQNSFAGMAVSGCTYVIQKLCSAAKPMAVVYTEEERDNFLREAIKQVKARRAQDATGENKEQLDLSQLQVDLWPHRDPTAHVHVRVQTSAIQPQPQLFPHGHWAVG